MDFDGDWFDAPWPSEHLRGDDGLIDVSGFPNAYGIGFVEQVQAMAAGRDGFGLSSGIFFALPESPGTLPTVAESVDATSPVALIGLEPGSPDEGVRVPILSSFAWDPGPFGAPNQLALLPLQGRPLRPGELYAAVVLRDLGTGRGERLAMAPALQDAEGVYAEALDALEALGLPGTELAAAAVFRTQDPQAELRAVLDEARGEGVALLDDWALIEEFDGYCVYRNRLEVPVYQGGEPPYDDGGGTFVGGVQRREIGRVEVTIPRTPTPEFPTAVFVRTGGGGDRPLVHRGVLGPDGVPLEPGTGLAQELAAVGVAGVSIDGPHGGLRNVTGGDEQFLMFNVLNPGAMRDNVRQSALELALLPDVLGAWRIPTADCAGAPAESRLQADDLTLIGHSMGATIGPLAVGLRGEFSKLVLSGAGGSWIHNVVHKLSPLEVRPLAEALLRYPEGGWELTDFDPVLSLLQWAGESADPPVQGASFDGDVLMVQGIVDTYILPPLANATSLSLGLQLGGEARDDDERLAAFDRWGDVAPLVGATPISLPGSGRVLVQYDEDGVEDGHEVFFQRSEPKQQLRCFLATGVVPAEGEPCPQ